MAEEEKPNLSEEMNASSAYPMCFGVSCAFLALQFLAAMDDRANAEPERRNSALGEMMLRGSAQLLGLLLERAQKRHDDLREKERVARSEAMELKRIRTEDARANEKVMSIFATREQSWKDERRRLLHQIRFLFRELSAAKSSNEMIVSDLKKREIEEQELRLIKDDLFEEEARKMEKLEEKLLAVQKEAEELRERVSKEAQDHASELRRHKAAFAELVSNQRKLDAEMARLLRQIDVAKEELVNAFEQKEEAMAMVGSLSAEFSRLQKDAEQKGKIVSAMLRKGKHDAAEKQALLKEVKLTRAKKKQAELEAERWKSACEAKQKKSSRELASVEPGSSGKRAVQPQSSSRLDLRARLLEFLAPESSRDEHEFPLLEKVENAIKPIEFQDQNSNDGGDDDNALELQDWVRIETKKYTAVLEQKHYSEIEAFAEQLRMRDEKLDALQWRLLSTELDSKTLQSHIEGLDGSLTQLRDENLNLEALLEDRERDLKSLMEEKPSFFHGKHFQAASNPPPPIPETSLPQSFDSLMKATKREAKGGLNLYEAEKNVQEKNEIVLLRQFRTGMDAETTIAEEQSNDETSSELRSQPLIEEGIEEEREVGAHKRHNSLEEDACSSVSGKLAFHGQPFSLKTDIQALGVSFKIKRLRQQLLILKNLAGGHETAATAVAADSNNERAELKGVIQVIFLLNKQLNRYQSLEEKTDALCRKMLESSGTAASRLPRDAASKEETGKLEQFLEETFQLQRYMVATGQKLAEVRSKIESSLDGIEEEEEGSAGFDLGQFLHVVGTLFKEVQSGLEVRIARIIGDIEGTLASEGILRRR